MRQQKQREKNRCEDGNRIWNDSIARWGPLAKERGQPLQVRKDKEMGFPLRPGEEMRATALTSRTVRLYIYVVCGSLLQ